MKSVTISQTLWYYVKQKWRKKSAGLLHWLGKNPLKDSTSMMNPESPLYFPCPITINLNFKALNMQLPLRRNGVHLLVAQKISFSWINRTRAFQWEQSITFITMRITKKMTQPLLRSFMDTSCKNTIPSFWLKNGKFGMFNLLDVVLKTCDFFAF